MKVLQAAVAVLVASSALFSAAPAFAAPNADSRVAGSQVGPVHSKLDPASPAPSDEPPALIPQTHPLTVAPDAQPTQAEQQKLAQPNGKVAPSSTASLSGTVSWRDGGQSPAGLTVTAVIFDDSGVVKFTRTTTTDAAGAFAIGALDPANYYIGFSGPAPGGSTIFQWWGSSRLNPFGAAVTLADGEARTADWSLIPTGSVGGTVTCGQCASALDLSTLSVVVLTYNFDTSKWVGLLQMPVDPQGTYEFDDLYASTSVAYATAVVYNGTDSLSPYSYTDRYDVPEYSLINVNAIVSRLIQPVPAYDDQYGMADNSVVNALYSDFLNRLPALSEATGWVAQLYNGADRGAVSAGFVNSDEYRLIRIDAAYQNVLGRKAEAAGRLNWLSAMKTGGITTDDIETSLYASQEYYLQHGDSNVGFVTSLYRTLLHRDGTASDYSFWSGLVSQHGRGWVIAQYWDATETISQRVQAMYNAYLGRTPDAQGLANWVGVALQIGDSGLRSAFTGSTEYFVRSQYRFSES